jgi:glycosyltransferase involved in cell wall biosynthesis
VAKRLKIYTKLVNIKMLDLSNGDRINEINLYEAMSTFADVYYNGHLFSPGSGGGSFSSRHSGLSINDYDLCFLRNSKDEFWDIFKQRGPAGPRLLWVGSPYDEKIFKSADGIVAYTESWTRQLRNYKENPFPGLYEKDIYVPKNILTFPQSICTQKFSSKKGHKKTARFRKNFADGRDRRADFIIGHFGRLADSCYPHSLIHILPELRERYPNKSIKLVYAGLPAQNRIGRRGKSLIKKVSPIVTSVGSVDYADMPYAISACDLIASNYRVGAANWGGSRHVLEAASCGIPILTGDFSVRKEQLGDDYPLFWPWQENNGRISNAAEKIMLEHICDLIDNPKKKVEIGERLAERMKRYSAEAIGKRLESEIKTLLRKRR